MLAQSVEIIHPQKNNLYQMQSSFLSQAWGVYCKGASTQPVLWLWLALQIPAEDNHSHKCGYQPGFLIQTLCALTQKGAQNDLYERCLLQSLMLSDDDETGITDK